MKRIILLTFLVCFGKLTYSQIQPEFIKNVNSPGNFIELNGEIYLTCSGTDLGLWKTDGTNAGTIQIKSFSSIRDMFKFNNMLYFRADDGVNGIELWKSDGTTPGTQMVKNINPTGDFMGSFDLWLNVVGLNEFFFTAEDGIHGRELWKSDGTEAGTVMVKDMVPGSGSSEPQQGIFFNNELYFTSSDNSVGRELFKSDGTEVGTVLVKDFYVDPTITNNGFPNHYTIFDNQLFFYANSSDLTATGHGLFKITTSSSVPQLVKEVRINSTPLYKFNNAFYFGSPSGTWDNSELWKSDGTASGTSVFTELNATGASNPGLFYEFNNTLYFVATPDIATGTELFKTDGTVQGTQMVKNINPSNGEGSSINNFFELEGVLHFIANEPTYGWEIWKTNGTDAGTTMAYDINPGPNTSYSGNFTKLLNKIFFSVGSGPQQQGLWKFDLPSSDLSEMSLSKIEIYPNPTKSSLHIITHTTTNASILSLDGMLKVQIEINGENTIDVSSYAPGVYFIHTEEGQTVKFIKQ